MTEFKADKDQDLDEGIELLYQAPNKHRSIHQAHFISRHYETNVFVSKRGNFFFKLDQEVIVCFINHGEKPVEAQIIINLSLPELEDLPTKEEGEVLNRELFNTNSKLIEVINEQVRFEKKEKEGQNVVLN